VPGETRSAKLAAPIWPRQAGWRMFKSKTNVIQRILNTHMLSRLASNGVATYIWQTLPASSHSNGDGSLSMPWNQGLTLAHFSAQLEQFLTQKHTLNTLITP
jgi:hypothetical protein